MSTLTVELLDRFLTETSSSTVFSNVNLILESEADRFIPDDLGKRESDSFTDIVNIKTITIY